MRNRIIVLLFGILLASPAVALPAEDETAPRDEAWIVSPVVGCNRNELETPQGPGRPTMTLTDTGAEYGIFAMYASPRLVVNNILFFTRVNDADVWGDIAYVNVYGDPAASLTWNVGGGYVWHKVDSDSIGVDVSEPLAKAGVLIRCPSFNLTLNPFLGYEWEQIDISIPAMTGSHGSMGPSHTNQNTEAVLYGMSASWRWRMLQANVKYYLADNRDLDKSFNVVRFWCSAMFSRNAGLLARFEYMEQTIGSDTSVVVGPVFMF